MVNLYLHGSALFKPFYPKLIWDKKGPEKSVYLTFDDGPEPEATSYVLETLERYGFKATFFCIGENVVKNPQFINQITAAGHTLGNHTQHHLNGFDTPLQEYIDNISAAATHIDSRLFRPPYGRIKRKQINVVQRQYDIIMWSIISGDFDERLNVNRALGKMKKLTKTGSIVVFHDSLKALDNLKFLLPRYCDFLIEQGYTSCKLS